MNTRTLIPALVLAALPAAADAQFVCYDQMGPGGAYGAGLLGGLSSLTTPDGILWGNAAVVADATATGTLGRIAFVVYFAEYGGSPGGEPDQLDYTVNFWSSPEAFLAEPHTGTVSGNLGPPINPDADTAIGQYVSSSGAFLQYVFEWDASKFEIPIVRGQRFALSVQAEGPEEEGIMLVCFSNGLGSGELVGLFASQSIPAGYLSDLGAPYDRWAGRLAINPSCAPDCNQDGLLNVNDFICFQSAWRRREPYGDFDHSGVYNINDFISFQSAWRRGVEGGGCS